jgi:hypothetical protein
LAPPGAVPECAGGVLTMPNRELDLPKCTDRSDRASGRAAAGMCERSVRVDEGLTTVLRSSPASVDDAMAGFFRAGNSPSQSKIAVSISSGITLS